MNTDQTAAIESGEVLSFSGIAFDLDLRERRFLNPRWSNPREKNISLEGGELRGTKGAPDDVALLAVMLMRFRAIAVDLAAQLFPRYPTRWRIARTSFRPVPVEGRQRSWREDDTRLHVDAFPARPTGGARLLRVFANVGSEPRVGRPLPGVSALAAALRFTRGRRTAYDSIMLRLHNAMKRDEAYQRDAPRRTIAFEPSTFWTCFSDQVSHAALSGQFLLEQTIELPVEAMDEPERSPLRILERMTGRRLG